MKGIKMKKIIVIIVLALAPVLIYAQPVPPPPSSHGASGNQPGGGAPIDGGLSILLIMGAIYGTKKTIQIFKKESQN